MLLLCSVHGICSETETCVQPVMEMGGVGNFLSCPECKECFETKGEKGPLSLRCGHTFCSGIIISTIKLNPMIIIS